MLRENVLREAAVKARQGTTNMDFTEARDSYLASR